MGILHALLAAWTGWINPQASVRSHLKSQAYGPHWSRRRNRRIPGHMRRRPRRRRRPKADSQRSAG